MRSARRLLLSAFTALLCIAADCSDAAPPNCPSNQVAQKDSDGRWSCVDSR